MEIKSDICNLKQGSSKQRHCSVVNQCRMKYYAHFVRHSTKAMTTKTQFLFPFLKSVENLDFVRHLLPQSVSILPTPISINGQRVLLSGAEGGADLGIT